MANPFGNLGNMGNLMKQAQKMMEDAKKIEEELGNERVEASAGGGWSRLLLPVRESFLRFISIRR
jgi:DNA-binding protein YbaB